MVEHCVNSAKGYGFDSQEHTDNTCITRMHCKSLWIKASAKCVNVNVILWNESIVDILHQIQARMKMSTAWLGVNPNSSVYHSVSRDRG